MKKMKCDSCKGFGYYDEKVEYLYLNGMKCNCGGNVR